MNHPSTPPAKPSCAAALDLYRWRSPVYDLQMAPYEAIRQHAITRLALQPGQTVLDIGCGTGMSLPWLREAVGPSGRVIAVDQSPDMLDEARQCIARQGWSNVMLVCAPILAAKLPAQADAALFHFTHDILQEPAVVAHVLRHLKPGARISASGLQWAPAWAAPWAWPLNSLVWLAAMHSVTTLQGLHEPWQLLREAGVVLEVETLMMGTVYVATGHLGPVTAKR